MLEEAKTQEGQLVNSPMKIRARDLVDIPKFKSQNKMALHQVAIYLLIFSGNYPILTNW